MVPRSDWLASPTINLASVSFGEDVHVLHLEASVSDPSGPKGQLFCLRDNATDLSRPEEFLACFLVSTYATRPATACPLAYLPSAST
jgi:hypothetical protein